MPQKKIQTAKKSGTQMVWVKLKSMFTNKAATKLVAMNQGLTGSNKA
jgi:hypothetical protein